MRPSAAKAASYKPSPMPTPSSSQAMTSRGIEPVSPSSTSPAASTTLEIDNTDRPPTRSIWRPIRGPSRAASTSATENAPNTQFEDTPRSRAIGSARIAGRYMLEAHARVWVVPSARMTGSRRPLMPGALPLDRAAFACRWHLRAAGPLRQAGRRKLARATIARHNGAMELSSRVELMNWLVGQGLTGLPEPDLIRGFCERCRAGGLGLPRVMGFIDTLHPIYEGRGFRWNDRPTNESHPFEHKSSAGGDPA